MAKNEKKSNKQMGLTKKLIDTGVNAGASVVGTLIGLAVGGPIGAIVGATVPPAISTGANLAIDYWERKRKRAESIVTKALGINTQSEEAIVKLCSNEDKIDEFIHLIRSALDNDKSLDMLYSRLLRELMQNESSDLDRIFIFDDAIQGLRAIHLKILRAIYFADGTLSASDIAKSVNVPEIELRGIVRTLELKGMIKDLEKEPTEWELREMGKALVEYLILEEKK